MAEIQDITLEDVLSDAQTLELSPQETAAGIRRWHDKTLDWAASAVPEDQPETYFQGRQELERLTAEALDGVRQAAVVKWAGSKFQDAEQWAGFLDRYTSADGDAAALGEEGNLANELNALAEDGVWSMPRSGNEWSALNEPGGAEIGRFQVMPRGEEIDVQLSFGSDEGRRLARLSVPHVKDEDIEAERVAALERARQAQEEISISKTLDSWSSMDSPEASMGLAAQREAAQQRVRAAALRAQTLADPNAGRQLLLSERVNEAVKSNPKLRDVVGDKDFGEDFIRGVSGFYTGTRVAWNDISGDEAERDVWRQHLSNLKQYFPGSTQRRNVGGLEGFTSEAVEGLGGMAPQILTMLTGGGAALNATARAALQAGGRGLSTLGLSAMGAGAYGAGVEEVLSRADQLEQEAAQIEVEFPEAAAQMRDQAAWARENYRAIAGGKAAVEIASERILPEETLLTRGLTGGNALSRFAGGVGKSFAEGVAAEAGNQTINAGAFSDAVSPVELLRGGALEAAAGAPMVAVGAVPGQGGRVPSESPQSAAPVLFSAGLPNETAFFSIGPKGPKGAPITEKTALSEAGYPAQETEAFVDRYFNPDAYSVLAGDDVVWVVAPTTSGKNPLPQLLADRLARSQGGQVVSDLFGSLSGKESKKKRGYVNKMLDPVAMSLDQDKLSELRGKRVVLVDDIMTTGETTDVMRDLLQEAGVPIAGAAVLSAVEEGRLAGEGDLRKLARLLAAQTAKPFKQVLEDVTLAHSQSRGRMITAAIKDANQSNDSARQVYDLLSKRAATIRKALSSRSGSLPQRPTVAGGTAGPASAGTLPQVASDPQGGSGLRPQKPELPQASGRGGQDPGESRGGPGASSLTEWGKRSFGKRLKADDRLRQTWRETIKSTYRRETEVEWQERANQFIAENGVEGAAALYFDAESGLAPSDRMALGAQLVLRLDAEIRSAEIAGDGDRVQLLDDILYEISEDVDSTATKFGQAIRVLGMWTRMSAAGVLRHFTRKVNQAREEQLKLTLGMDGQDLTEQVAATAAEERADAAAEALGIPPADQLAELQQQVEQLRQQLAAATSEAQAARDVAAQATDPVAAAQAEQQAQAAEQRRQRSQRELRNAEARLLAKRERTAAKPRGRAVRRINPQVLAQRLIDSLATSQSDTPTIQSAARRAQSQVRKLAADYAAGRLDGPGLQAALQALGIPALQADLLRQLLDTERARAAQVSDTRQQQRQAEAAARLADQWSERLAQRQSDTPPADPQRQASAMAQLIRDYLRAEDGSLPDFVAQATALGVPSGRAVLLQSQLDTERRAIAAIARERAIARLTDQLTPKLALPAMRQRVPRFIQKLFDASEVGALARPEFLQAYAEAFDLPVFTPEMQKRLRALIDAQRAAPEGHLKQAATTELMAELAKFKGVSALEIGTAYWYANILSGVSTQGVNLTGSAWHLFARSLVMGFTHHPADTLRMIRGMIGEGRRRGLMESAAALRSGSTPYKGELNFTAGQTLELIHSDNPKTWGDYLKNGVALGRYVFRALTAGDALFYHMAKEGQAWLAASRYAREQRRTNGGDFAVYLAEQLMNSPAALKAAQQQARTELSSAGRAVSDAAVQRRAWEIMEDQRPQELTNQARQWAALITYTGEPEGTMGAVAGALNDLHRRFTLPSPWGPVRVLTPVIPFVNIICNVTSSALDFTPVGIVRGALGRHLRDSLDRSADGFTPWERKQRLAAGALSSIAYTLLYSWARGLKDEDDDRVPFMVYGMGPPSKSKRDQMPQGWRPYTVKIGDTYWSYAETPLAIGLSVIGGLLDKERYGSGTARQEATSYVFSMFGGALMKTGVLSSVDDLFSMMSGDKSPKSTAVRSVTGFIPAQGLLRDISELVDGHKIDDTTLAAAFFKDVPILRNVAGRPPLNVFGEPVQLDVMQRLPVVKRTVTGQGEDPQGLWLAQNKLWLPGMDREVTVGTYLTQGQKESLDEKAKRNLGRVMTPDEQYRFVQASGREIRAVVSELQDLQKRFPEVKPEQLQSRLSSRVLEVRRKAMRKALGFKD